MSWSPFESGASIGTEGSESGTILADFEHDLGARITIERDGETAPFAITCGIYEWFVHTRFFSAQEEAEAQCRAMQSAMEEILAMTSKLTDPDNDPRTDAVSAALYDFVDTFP